MLPWHKHLRYGLINFLISYSAEKKINNIAEIPILFQLVELPNTTNRFFTCIWNLQYTSLNTIY